MDELSPAQARRLAVAGARLHRPRPAGTPGIGHLARVLRHQGIVQIDSVNVLARAHLVPFFSRLGPYDTGLVDRLARERRSFEYWAHEACLVDVALEPLLRWRMAAPHRWGSVARVVEQVPVLVAEVERAVHEAGPLTAAEVGELVGRGRPQAERATWWGWDEVKLALEHLFWHGRVAARRRAGFEREYCHPDDAIPAAIRSQPTPEPDDAMRGLLLVAARTHGIATATDLADYWRVRRADVVPLLADLVEDGRLRQLRVRGWRDAAYVPADAVVPRRVAGASLVSPFDVAMWDRRRIERVHGFRYTIEIYVPAAQRVHGYYVLPFLLGDTYVARVDLKADRAGRALLVRASHAEALVDPSTDGAAVATALATELRCVAEWLDLDDVVVEPAGDLAPALARAVSRGGG